MSLPLQDQKGFIPFFKSLPEKTSATIRFFNRGDYYTVHGADALFTAKELFKSTNGIKILGSDNNTLESLVVSRSNFDSFLRDLLLVKQYRVEVYVNKGKGNADWVAEYKGSPGNLQQFEDVLFSGNDQLDSSSVIAVKLGGDAKCKVVGVGFVNLTEKQLAACEFPDDDHFTNLEGLLVQLGPKECLLPAGESGKEYETLKEVMKKAGILVTPRKKNEFATADLVLDLNKLIRFEEGQQQNALALPEMSFKIAMPALAAVVKYLELMSDDSNANIFSLSTLDLSRYVHMDTAALRALNLFPPPGMAPDRKNSILGLLDKCRTPQGRRLLMQWIKQPLRDKNAISERHDIVEILLKNGQTLYELHEKLLSQIPDFLNLSKRLLRRKATMQECYRIYQALGSLPDLIASLKAVGETSKMHVLFVEPLQELQGDMQGFHSMIETTLDMDEVEQGNFLIKPSFDQDLQEYRETMDKTRKEMDEQLPRVAADLGLEGGKSLKLESASHLGYYFRITLKEEKVLRTKKQYEIVDTSKSGVRFRNSKLNNLNSVYLETWNKYNEHQKSVIDDVIEVAVTYADSLHNLGSVIAQLDVLTSFAKVARDTPNIEYIRPVLHEKGTGILSLKQLRHPCMELLESVQFVPNDVYFKHDDCTFHIITGPNMGGKSTYIRSVGVVVFMAQIGSFVPCQEAEISVVDAILARVGADDCQLKGMSTFMKEMVETAAIIRTATKDSLVIIDELGRGTSTYEGCGIAWAIAEHLAKEVKAFCLFATHFHELTQLAEEVPTVKNQHVNALIMENSLTLTFNVKPGPSDQSFGIHVAEMAGFPNDVIEYAKNKQAELEDYQGLNFATEGTDKQTIIKEGEKLIAEFLNKCKKLQTNDMSEADIMEQIEKYKEEIKAKNNPYIQALLAQVSESPA